MIEKFLNYASAHKCSDLHLASGSVPMVRYNGDILPIPGCEIIKAEQMNSMLLSIMNEMQQKKFKQDLELDFSIQLPSGVRFRANAFHTITGPAISLREVNAQIKNLQEIKAPSVLFDIASARRGLVLLVGPAGTGKSTTIAAMIDQINSGQSRHIITIEDPIEFVHRDKRSLISQREVGINTMSFSAALRSALREDPDVIMIGEMRDVETVRLALTAAETGHLVFATLHTHSASQAINRIIDIFPGEDKLLARAMLSISLRAIISQRLLKSKDGGRSAAYEVLLANSAVRNCIREERIAQINSLIELGKKEGMILMKESIAQLLNSGVITKEVAEEVLLGEIS